MSRIEQDHQNDADQLKNNVRAYYDGPGWEKINGQYFDWLWTKTNPLIDLLWEIRKERDNKFLTNTKSKKYFLDAASGANPSVTFSKSYNKHICVDLSIKGLKQAKEILKDKALCIVADICHLPFKDCTINCFVSAHTIYHIPGFEEQGKAFNELCRVLARAQKGLIIYVNPNDYKTKIAKLKEKIRAIPVFGGATVFFNRAMRQLFSKKTGEELKKFCGDEDNKTVKKAIEMLKNRKVYYKPFEISSIISVLTISCLVKVRPHGFMNLDDTSKLIKSTSLYHKLILHFILMLERITYLTTLSHYISFIVKKK